MGASVVAYWPGITEDQAEAQPGFANDDRAWGNWMAERDGDAAVTWTTSRRLHSHICGRTPGVVSRCLHRRTHPLLEVRHCAFPLR
jgi:hypothetical protein